VIKYIQDEFKTTELLNQIDTDKFYQFNKNYIEKYTNKYLGSWDLLIKSDVDILNLLCKDDPDFKCDSYKYESEMQDENNYYLIFYMFDKENNFLCVNLQVIY
jgi:hypothetical protein